MLKTELNKTKQTWRTWAKDDVPRSIKKLNSTVLGLCHTVYLRCKKSPLGGDIVGFFFCPPIPQWHHYKCNRATRMQPRRKKYANPSIVAWVSNISHWLYGKNVKEPIFSLPLSEPYVFRSNFLSPYFFFLSVFFETLPNTITGYREKEEGNVFFSDNQIQKSLVWKINTKYC